MRSPAIAVYPRIHQPWSRLACCSAGTAAIIESMNSPWVITQTHSAFIVTLSSQAIRPTVRRITAFLGGRLTSVRPPPDR